MNAAARAALCSLSLLTTGLGCAQVIGLADWKDSGAGGANGAGGVGGAGGAGLGGGGAGGEAGTPFLPNWGARVLIDVDTSRFTASLPGFTLPIITTLDADIAAKVAPNGTDLRVTTEQGDELPSEVERYLNGALVMWVRIPELNTPALRLYLYMDNPSASTKTMEWPDHAAVYHLGGANNLAQTDSSANEDHTETPIVGAGSISSVTGRAGRALSFTSGAHVPIAAGASSLEFSLDSFTMSVWVNASPAPAPFQCVVFNGGADDTDLGYSLGLNALGPTAQFQLAGPGGALKGDLGTFGPGWHQLAVSVDRDRGIATYHIDGEETGSEPLPMNLGSIANSAHTPSINHPSCGFVGVIDELRFAHGASTSARITAEYVTIAEPLIDVGLLELAP